MFNRWSEFEAPDALSFMLKEGVRNTPVQVYVG